MGGAVSTGKDNDDLVDNLMVEDDKYIRTKAVERVFRLVDRASYYLPEARSSAYRDVAWKEGNIHISAPCIYSEVMEAIAKDIKPGMSFLNVGSGTGYLSTMVGLLLGPYGVNHGIEVHESNVKYAMEKLQEFLKTSVALRYFDFTPPKFVVGNGMSVGTELFGKYDRMYVGAACPTEELVLWFSKFLKTDGVLILPFQDHLVKIKRESQDDFTRENIMQCSFASLIVPAQPQAEPITFPSNGWTSLKYLCRLAINHAIRNRILTDHPETFSARSHAPHPIEEAPPRRNRIVFPLFLAPNGNDNEPHIIVGDFIQANDNGNNPPEDGELPVIPENHEPATAASQARDGGNSLLGDVLNNSNNSNGPTNGRNPQSALAPVDGPGSSSTSSDLNNDTIDEEPANESQVESAALPIQGESKMAAKNSVDVEMDGSDATTSSAVAENPSTSEDIPFDTPSKNFDEPASGSSSCTTGNELDDGPGHSSAEAGSSRAPGNGNGTTFSFSVRTMFRKRRLSARQSTGGSTSVDEDTKRRLVTEQESNEETEPDGPSTPAAQPEPDGQDEEPNNFDIASHIIQGILRATTRTDSEASSTEPSQPAENSDAVQPAVLMEQLSVKALKSLQCAPPLRKFLNFDRTFDA